MGTTPYTFVLPRTFQPMEFLPARLWTRSDDARWLISTITRKAAARDTDPWGFARLHSSILRRVMGTNYLAPITKALESGGAIETAKHYPGIKSKGFRLTERFLRDRSIQVRATDPRFLKRFQAEQDRQKADQRARWQPIHYALDQEQQALTITDEADAILDELPDHTRLCQSVLVDRIQRRELPFSVSTTGRCFNAISGLKRDIRPALRLDGSPLGSVDLVNAQPSLLAMLLDPNFPTIGGKKQESYKHTTPDCPPSLPSACLPLLSSSDAALFAELSFSGSLYEYLMDHTRLDRATVKLAVLRDVLAKRGRYPSLVERVFRDAFPSVFRIIRAVNRDDHGELIRRLQRAESWLVVGLVTRRLLGRIRTVTLHDAVYSGRGDVCAVEGAFAETFERLGVSLSLKVE